ncbi:dihydrolipoamide acetyltransferase family protein [Crenobacter sp. SG2303]|uniref:Dihydrolipoamide acetyltransferase component of pyruvate dehydrogenase complex n=1 Tax=Crenobacter oryzisoli TaxID=3056844 RepID=A0ABT7XQU9_9NEIS|nr:dihydrolipoamide acetyltransferase family protein [Crenobacter sp. SG2303]MDN0076120.1 dihydrolipoamide acetyltransferase family protein [Crenobacter sp. SG2303]
MIEFKLPSLGADMDEGKLLEWKIQPGATVKRGDIVAIVDTAKAAVDIESWVEGTVHQLLIEVGDKVPVGTPIALLLAPGETAESVAQPAAAVPRRRISPAARQRAAALGVDLASVTGTGPDGAVTLQDVETRAAQTTAPSVDRGAEMRRAIAAAMSRSKREIPHYYLSEAIPLRLALSWLERCNAELPVTERLLPAVLLLKAVAIATRRYPEMNGHWLDGAFRVAPAAHLGVAISLRQGGLIAPALHDVAAKPLDVLMHELADLVRRARAGSLRSSELADPTLTVTNLGEQGCESVFGVIYPPQVALVGFGRVMERPWLEQGKLVAMPSVIASLSGDHRASDGHRGALFLAEIRTLLQQPDTL